MKKLIKDIWSGEAGLAKIFWVYGFIGTTFLGIPMALVTPGSIPAVIIVIVSCLYIVLVNVGTWKAAGKYSGSKIWKILPRAAILLTLASFLIGILATILIPSAAKNRHDESVAMVLNENESHVQQVNSEMNMREARKRIPELAGLSDESALNVIHQVYYPNMDKQELAKRLGVQLAIKTQSSELGFIDRWRYESCQKEAVSAPTPQGVNIGIRLCKEKFAQ
jgi:hypothetical protein